MKSIINFFKTCLEVIQEARRIEAEHMVKNLRGN